jgi:hypothetical protein
MPKRLLLAIAVSFSPFNVAGFTLPTTLTVPRSSKAGESQIHRLPNQNKYVTSFKASAAVDTDAPTETAALGAWIPLGSASCLDGLTPTQITVCGLDLVVWQSKDKTSKKGALGTFSAFMDACPHRLAPLSHGRVDPVTGCLGESSSDVVLHLFLLYILYTLTYTFCLYFHLQNAPITVGHSTQTAI